MARQNKLNRSIVLWVLAFLLTISLATYQRLTGPTYPVSGDITIANESIDYELIRTFGGNGDAPVFIHTPEDADIKGYMAFRRYKSHDHWDTISMQRRGDTLIAMIPHQPPAGKVQYNILLESNNELRAIEAEPVIIRFKGAVPERVLVPHIILMFLAMFFSIRAGLEAIFKGQGTYLYTILTLAALIPGGLILGPIIQHYAFGDYWTGWPVSNDLTDNKTLIAFIFWFIAFIIQYRNRQKKGWALIASIVLLIVYLIPHSVMGSEIDFREQQHLDTEQQAKPSVK
ncbi:MAG: hypothetical protein R6T91_07350 [Bacteroidales bacterium]